jgi:heme/copper-type cytochrome/quinol oxidase subunit 4
MCRLCSSWAHMQRLYRKNKAHHATLITRVPAFRLLVMSTVLAVAVTVRPMFPVP